MSSFDDSGLPEGFEPGMARVPNRGTVRANGQKRGIDHFAGFGLALDAALDKMTNANNDEWSVTFSATVQPVRAADGGDPGIVIEYIATLT